MKVLVGILLLLLMLCFTVVILGLSNDYGTLKVLGPREAAPAVYTDGLWKSVELETVYTLYPGDYRIRWGSETNQVVKSFKVWPDKTTVIYLY